MRVQTKISKLAGYWRETKRPVIGCGRRTDRSALEFRFVVTKNLWFYCNEIFFSNLAAILLTMVFFGVFFFGIG
jgi:hypothetical protein